MNSIQQIDAERVRSVFFPYATQRLAALKAHKARLVHYTSAEVAVSILKNREVWMRNATTMNDYMEVEHGIECLHHAYKGEAGQLFKKVLDENFPGAAAEIETRFNAWLPELRRDTYLTCVSEHHDSEDTYGRLSMWRAYGGKTGVALVLNSAPFYSETNVLKAYSSPVAYLDEAQFASHFAEVVAGMASATDLIQQIGREQIFRLTFNMLRFAVLCTKHPGFQEEQEWRVIYSPTMELSERIVASIETVGGTPQKVFKIPLRNVPEQGLYGMEVPEIIDRIIIGPTKFPGAIYQAFHQILIDLGVPNPEQRIAVSDIPLR